MKLKKKNIFRMESVMLIYNNPYLNFVEILLIHLLMIKKMPQYLTVCGDLPDIPGDAKYQKI